jgi:2-oxoglutarate ferredoxin oxidoreductase subunit alpha
MVDDVRLAVLGAAPVTFIGGLSMDSSGFGIAPDLDVKILRGRLEAVLARSRDNSGSAASGSRLGVS